MTSWFVLRPHGAALLACVLMAGCGGGGSAPSLAAPSAGSANAAASVQAPATDGAAPAEVPVVAPPEPGRCAFGADVPPALTRRDCAP